MRHAGRAAGAAASMLFVIANVSPLFAGEAASPPQPAVGKSLSQGMAYQALREKLLAAGWLPLRDPQCWDNIGGEAAVCNQLPETESCSVDGRCIMHFASRQDRAKVRVGTEGPYEKSGCLTVAGTLAPTHGCATGSPSSSTLNSRATHRAISCTWPACD